MRGAGVGGGCHSHGEGPQGDRISDVGVSGDTGVTGGDAETLRGSGVWRCRGHCRGTIGQRWGASGGPAWNPKVLLQKQESRPREAPRPSEPSPGQSPRAAFWGL